MAKNDPKSQPDKRNTGEQEAVAQRLASLIKEGKSVVTQIAAARAAYEGEQKLEHKRNRRPLWGAFVATAVYALFAIFQWLAMNKTLGLERPWIGPSGTRDIFKDNQRARLTGVMWHFKNGGRSPATKVRSDLRFVFGPDTNTSDDIPVNEICKRGPLLNDKGALVAIPGIDYDIPVSVEPDILKRLDEVYSTPPTAWIFIVGCIDYSDSSGHGAYRTNIVERFFPPDHFAIESLGNTAY